MAMKANKPKLIFSSQKKISFQSDCDCDCAVFFDYPEEDCACAGSPQYLPEKIKIATDSHSVLSFSDKWHALYLPQGTSSLVMLNEQALELWQGYEKNSSTLDAEFVDDMYRAGLLVNSARAKSDEQTPHRTQLSAWLHVTDRCNLRCAYCYLPHKKEDMTLETGIAAIDTLFREAKANHYQRVKLKYAGGEPLIRFPFVVKLHQYAQKLADQTGLGLDAVILSNGTLLTDEIITTMQMLNVRLMISLDGMEEWHDSQRPYAGGQGTFKDIAKSVDLALSYGLIPDISITVSGRSAEGLPKIIAWVLERNLPFSLNFYRQNDLSVSHTDLKLEEEKIIDGMLAAFAVIEENLPSRSLLASLTDRANLAVPHTKTCSVGDSYLVFNQHGQVAKCQMKIGQPIADVNTENLLEVVRSDKSGIQNISVEEKEGCRDCEWKYWCTGGCPLETYRATGRYDVKSPNCNIYKTIFPEV